MRYTISFLNIYNHNKCSVYFAPSKLFTLGVMRCRGFRYRDFGRGGIRTCFKASGTGDFASVELLLTKAYLIRMKSIQRYLILCLLFVMPLQSIAAGFQLACQDNHKTSVATEKKMSHCHQTKEHKQSKEVQSHNASHHCLSFCAQAGMAALTSDTVILFSQGNDIVYSQYLYHYDSVISPSIQKPPISFS